MLSISTMNGHERMSTRELLLLVRNAVKAGETEFRILASGQHDIGGPLWNAEGKTLHFEIENPGQRLGSMALVGTEIVVRGSAPADVGWLNSGGQITVLGDSGDTTGHCAAAGVIHVAGRAGARTGSLMKHDPQHEPPELWVLGTVGSFAFEFMGGGRAVVCGWDESGEGQGAALGERPCVGMVGGVVYVRGACEELPIGVRMFQLDEEDRAWLGKGMGAFLAAVERPELLPRLSRWQEWHKLLPVLRAEACGCQPADGHEGLRAFHASAWPQGGLFGDVLADDGETVGLVPSGRERLRVPLWDADAGECSQCWACVRACPRAALRRRGGAADGVQQRLMVDGERCMGCGICACVCPQHLWVLGVLAPLKEGGRL